MKLFKVWGTVVCLWLAYANYTGWSLFGETGAKHAGPRGHVYHK